MIELRRVAVAGVGLLGATLARAFKRARPQCEVWGYDPAPPPAGVAVGVDRWAGNAEEAFERADLVVLAAPVSAILELLPRAARACQPQALVTDTGSTKVEICRAARAVFQAAGGPHFVGGHPMAGAERSGAAAADPDLLRGAPYALCADARVPPEKTAALEAFVRATGAGPVWLSPEAHDRIVARVSHLPQLAVVALGSILEERAAGEAPVAGMAGPGLRDLLRLASSSYPLWKDICRSNAPALREAIGELVERLREIAAGLEEDRLEHWFAEARRFRESRLRVSG